MFYYRIELDTLRNGLFTGYANDISEYVKSLNWQFGLSAPYEIMATSAYMELVLNNANGEFNLQDSNALYYGKIRKGALVRVRMSTDGSTWTTMCVLKVTDLVPRYANDGAHEVMLQCSDTLKQFYDREYIPPLQINVSINTALQEVHNGVAAIWPYETFYQFIGHTSVGDGRAPFYGNDKTSFETSATTLEYLGDNLDRRQGVTVSEYIREAVKAEIFGVYYFSPRDEKFHFLSRYHSIDTAISWYITDALFDVPQYFYGRDLINEYSLSYEPRKIGTAGTIIYDSDNLPIQIAARSTKTIQCKYRDPTQENASVGALEVLDSVMGVDIIANSEADGSGLDWTRFVAAYLKKGAGATEMQLFVRKEGDPLYITTLQIKGTPITTYNKETVFAINDSSIAGDGLDITTGNERASRSEAMSAVSDGDFAQNVADFMVYAFGDPAYAIERLVIPVKVDDTITQANVLSHTIGHVINIVDSQTGHNQDYMIVAEQHQVQAISDIHRVTYTLRPSLRGAVFTLGVSNSNANHVLTF